MAETAKGGRHGATYSIARTLGQLVASGHLTPQEIHDELHAATEQNGLLAEDRGNVTQTINDGIEKGIGDGPDPNHSERGDFSYTLPPKGARNAAGRLCSRCGTTAKHLWGPAHNGDVLCDTCRAGHTKRAGLVRRAADTIRPEEVDWYFEGWVPLGSLTLLVGPAGLGKTTLACELSARGTRGQLGSPAAAVIFATVEDSLAHTLVPRLTAAGADLARVEFVSIRGDDGFETGLTLPESNAALQTAVEETGAKLIVLDPVVGHLSGNIDSHKDHSVRRALAPLARLAEETGAAIIGIGHLNKSPSTDVLTRIGGSVGFAAAARSALILGEDPDAPEGSPERLLVHAKSNLGPLALAHRLKIGPATITSEGRDIGTSKIEWLGEELAATASKVLAGRQEPSRLDEATDFLREVLADGPLPASKIKTLAVDEGVTERTLKRARKKLGIASKREGFGAGSSWTLPSIVLPHSGHHSGQRPQIGPNGGTGSRKPCRTRVLPFGPTPPTRANPWPLALMKKRVAKVREIPPPFRCRSGLLVTHRRSGILTSPPPANRPLHTCLLRRRNGLPETTRTRTCLLPPRRGSRIPSLSTRTSLSLGNLLRRLHGKPQGGGDSGCGDVEHRRRGRPPRREERVLIFFLANFTVAYLVMRVLMWSLGGRLNVVFRLTRSNVAASFFLSIYLLSFVLVWL